MPYRTAEAQLYGERFAWYRWELDPDGKPTGRPHGPFPSQEAASSDAEHSGDSTAIVEPSNEGSTEGRASR